jgi:predicted AAA+ superfamily ATPase
LLHATRKASPYAPLNKALHDKLVMYLSRFMIVGGMPASVNVYREERNLIACQRVQNDILISLQADFPKYKNRVPFIRLYEVLKSVAYQSGTKFTYASAGTDYTSRQVKDTLELLVLAGLIHPVYHTSARGLPLGAGINTRKMKILFLDTGLMYRILDLRLSEMLNPKDFHTLNRGNMAELLTGLELIKARSVYENPDIYYWQREARGSNAEVDYLVQSGNRVVPVEVKAGTKGQMQSMFLFLKERNMDTGYRVSNENFASYGQIRVFPMYAVRNIFND